MLLWGPQVFACLTEPDGSVASWTPVPKDASWVVAGLPVPAAFAAPDAGIDTLSCIGVNFTLTESTAENGRRRRLAAAPLASVDSCGNFNRIRWPALTVLNETTRAFDAVGATRDSPWYQTRVGSPFYAEATAQISLVLQAREAPAEALTVELVVTPVLAAGCSAAFTLPAYASLPGSATEIVINSATLLTNLSAAGFFAAGGGNITHRCADGRSSAALTLHVVIRPRLWGLSGDVVQPAVTAPVRLGELVVSGATLALVAPTSARCSLLRSRLVAANGVPGGMPLLRSVPVLSDALPPLVLVPELPVPPAPGEVLLLSCEITGDRLAVLYPSQLLLSANGSEAVFSTAGGEQASWAQLTNLTVWPLFQGSRAPAGTTVPLRIECSATSRLTAGGFPKYADVTFSLPLVYLFAAWPFIGDATIHKLDKATLQPVNLPALSRPSVSNSSSTVASSRGGGAAVFEVVTNEAVNVTLTRDRTGWLHSGVDNPVFTWCTQVSVGDFSCPVVDVAVDGTWLTFTTPPYGTFEAGAAQQLEIRTPLLPGFSLLLACAPFCPTGEQQPAHQMPLVTSFLPAAQSRPPPPGMCSSLFGEQLPLTAIAAPLQLFAADAPPPISAHAAFVSASNGGDFAPPADLPGGGIVYYDSCTGAAVVWRDPMLPECRDRGASVANRSLAKLCAFGANGSCIECPVGAMCPGGLRAFAVPGSYTITPSYPIQLDCPAPAEERCLGWDVSNGLMQCGVGYTGVGCASCDKGFFPDDDSMCTKCPQVVGSGPLVLSLFYIFLACASIAVSIVLLTLVAIRVFGGGSVKGAGRRARELILFFWTSVQLLVQLSTVMQTSQVPPELQSLYRVFNRLNFQGLSLHPDCAGLGGVLSQQRLLYGAVTFLIVFYLAITLRCRVLVPSATVLGLTESEQREVDEALSSSAEALTANDDWMLDMSKVRGASFMQAMKDVLTRVRRVFTRGTARVSERSKRNLLLEQRLKSVRRITTSKLPWNVRVGLRVDGSRTMLQRVVLTLLVLLYPNTVKTAIESLGCKTEEMKVATYRGYKQDGSTLRRLGIPASIPPIPLTGFTSSKDILKRDPDANTPIAVRVLESSPYIVCHEGEHTSTAQWAAFVCVYYLAAFPLLSVLLGVHFKRNQAVAGGPDLSLHTKARLELAVVVSGSGVGTAATPNDGARDAPGLGRSEPPATAFRNPLQRAHLAKASARFKEAVGMLVGDVAVTPSGGRPAVAPSDTNGKEAGSVGTKEATEANTDRGSASDAAFSGSNPMLALARKARRRDVPTEPAGEPATTSSATAGGRGGVLRGLSAYKGAAIATSGKGAQAAAGSDGSADKSAAASTRPSLRFPPPPDGYVQLPRWAALDLFGLRNWLFRSEYRADCFWFKPVDLALAASLGAISDAWPTSAGAVPKALLTWALLAVTSSLLLIYRPYGAESAWMWPWKILGNVILAFITALVLIVDLKLGGWLFNAATRSIAFVVLALTAVFIVGVTLGFMVALFGAVKREAQEEEDVRVAAAIQSRLASFEDDTQATEAAARSLAAYRGAAVAADVADDEASEDSEDSCSHKSSSDDDEPKPTSGRLQQRFVSIRDVRGAASGTGGPGRTVFGPAAIG